jgi:hypothetical protein
MIPGIQNKRTNAAMASDAIIKAPTMKSRQRFFLIISPPQVLHLITCISEQLHHLDNFRTQASRSYDPIAVDKSRHQQ